ncbi:uncharacterized protein LOC126773314 isoform X2 [Nymphalis io]|uniref:uncharacterized protein LOC126773314 isoform X2 n=1 Tax=Inachis io TaxID=171585 RepID=UPI002168EEE5|nr:uncharacterized protein LOC126773314 isoform X2 [Nymphalis io]
MGRKGTVYRCVRKKRYTSALRKANEARKIKNTAIHSCSVTLDIENVDTEATIPIAVVPSSDEPLMQARNEIDTTMTVEKESEDNISCGMVRRKAQLSRESSKARRLRLLRRNETEDENMKRLQKQRLINRNNRLRESSAERFKRLNEQKERTASKRARRKYILKSASYDASANRSASNDINIDRMNNIRKKIQVQKFETEPGRCCSSSKFAAMTDLESDIQTEAECDPLECRACLQIMNADSVSYNIFESWTPPWDGMENSIAEDLAKIANLQISETDRHSKVICETCCQLLLNACNFAAIVKRNDQILSERYTDDTTEQKPFNEKVWPKPIQVDKSLASSMYDNPMNVEIKQEVLSDEENEYPVINGTYETSREEIPNMDIIKIEPEEMIQQQPLQIKVTVNGSIPLEELNTKESHLTNGNSDNGDHLISEVKEEPLSEEDDVDPVHSDLSLECMLCMKAFNSVTGLKAHVIAQHSYKSVKRKSQNSLSPEKKKCFTTSTDLMVHETCHNKSVCYGCNENFDTFDELTTHRRTCKAISNKEITKLKTLDDVLRPQMKEEINELKCEFCHEKFSDVYYMNIHQEIHHSNSEENEADDKNSMEVDFEKVFTSSKKKELNNE